MASLERLWKEGRDGALSPLEQMRALALRKAQRDIGGDKAVNLEKIADRDTKVGGGHPTRERIAPAGRGCAEEMCYRRRTRHQDGGRRVPTRGKKRLTTQGEKDGEDALRRPQSTAEGGASGGAGP